jgi:undecaprenyl-diphosphatase
MNETLFHAVHKVAGVNFLLDAVLIVLAEYLPYAIGALVLWKILKEPEIKRRILFFIETILTLLIGRGLITSIMRAVFPIDRPFIAESFTPLVEASGRAFPSGHAVFFGSLATAVFFYDRTWGIWLMVFAILNGVARIAAGVHWPGDIIGGLIVGILSALLVHILLRNSHKAIEAKHEEHGGE